MPSSSWPSRLVCIAWVAVVLFRLEIFQVGSGENEIRFSPLDIACFYGIHASTSRVQGLLVKSVCEAIALPGEMIRNTFFQENSNRFLTNRRTVFQENSKCFLAHRKILIHIFDLDDGFEDSKQWMTVNSLKIWIDPKQNYVSGLLATVTIISIPLAFIRPTEASLIFILGIIALQVRFQVNEPTLNIFEYVMYSIIIAFVAYVIAQARIQENIRKVLSKLENCHSKLLSEEETCWVIEVLGRYIGNRDVIYKGCVALMSLGVNAENKSKFGDAGICPLLVEILRKFENDRDVIYKGCGALWNLGLNAENQRKFGDAGICPLLVEILRKFENDRDVIYYGCGALMSLGVNAENQRKFGDAGIRPLLAEILRRHSLDISLMNIARNAWTQLN